MNLGANSAKLFFVEPQAEIGSLLGIFLIKDFRVLERQVDFTGHSLDPDTITNHYRLY